MDNIFDNVFNDLFNDLLDGILEPAFIDLLDNGLTTIIIGGDDDLQLFLNVERQTVELGIVFHVVHVLAEGDLFVVSEPLGRRLFHETRLFDDLDEDLLFGLFELHNRRGNGVVGIAEPRLRSCVRRGDLLPRHLDADLIVDLVPGVLVDFVLFVEGVLVDASTLVDDDQRRFDDGRTEKRGGIVGRRRRRSARLRRSGDVGQRRRRRHRFHAEPLHQHLLHVEEVIAVAYSSFDRVIHHSFRCLSPREHFHAGLLRYGEFHVERLDLDHPVVHWRFFDLYHVERSCWRC